MKRIVVTGAFALAMVLGSVSAYAQETCELDDSCDTGDDGGLGGGGLGGVGIGGGGPIKGSGGGTTPTPPAPSTPATGSPPPVGNSVTINFNNIGSTFSTYIEGNYKITLLSGSVVGGNYGAQNTRSLSVLGPGAQLYVPPAPGVTNTVSLTRLDGGLFSADSFFSVLAGSSGENTQTLDGYMLGALVSSSTTTSSVNGFAFSQASGLTGYYDQVRLSFSTTSSSSAFDNLTVTSLAAVPETATWAMFIGGFGFVGGALRRQRKASVRFA